jgi:hypothetical protein
MAETLMTTEPDTMLDEKLAREFERNAFNPCVGQILLSESERERVWFIRLEPGERLGFHRHVVDYFWTALTAGRAQSHIDGGPAQIAEYFAGQTKHLTFGLGQFMVHDLENIGHEALLFITVEHLKSANEPLPLPPGLRPQPLPAGALLA